MPCFEVVSRTLPKAPNRALIFSKIEVSNVWRRFSPGASTNICKRQTHSIYVTLNTLTCGTTGDGPPLWSAIITTLRTGSNGRQNSLVSKLRTMACQSWETLFGIIVLRVSKWNNAGLALFVLMFLVSVVNPLLFFLVCRHLWLPWVFAHYHVQYLFGRLKAVIWNCRSRTPALTEHPTKSFHLWDNAAREPSVCIAICITPHAYSTLTHEHTRRQFQKQCFTQIKHRHGLWRQTHNAVIATSLDGSPQAL